MRSLDQLYIANRFRTKSAAQLPPWVQSEADLYAYQRARQAYQDYTQKGISPRHMSTGRTMEFFQKLKAEGDAQNAIEVARTIVSNPQLYSPDKVRNAQERLMFLSPPASAPQQVAQAPAGPSSDYIRSQSIDPTTGQRAGYIGRRADGSWGFIPNHPVQQQAAQMPAQPPTAPAQAPITQTPVQAPSVPAQAPIAQAAAPQLPATPAPQAQPAPAVTQAPPAAPPAAPQAQPVAQNTADAIPAPPVPSASSQTYTPTRPVAQPIPVAQPVEQIDMATAPDPLAGGKAPIPPTPALPVAPGADIDRSRMYARTQAPSSLNANPANVASPTTGAKAPVIDPKYRNVTSAKVPTSTGTYNLKPPGKPSFASRIGKAITPLAGAAVKQYVPNLLGSAMRGGTK